MAVGQKHVVAEHEHRGWPVHGVGVEGGEHALLGQPGAFQPVLFDVADSAHEERRQ
jgi:hypothetical protein